MLLEDGDMKLAGKHDGEVGGLVHDGHRLRLVVAHVDVWLVDAQRAAREGLAELSGEGRGSRREGGRW